MASKLLVWFANHTVLAVCLAVPVADPKSEPYLTYWPAPRNRKSLPTSFCPQGSPPPARPDLSTRAVADQARLAMPGVNGPASRPNGHSYSAHCAKCGAVALFRRHLSGTARTRIVAGGPGRACLAACLVGGAAGCGSAAV